MKNTILSIWMTLLSIHLSAQNIIKTDKLPEVVIKGTGDNNLLLIPCMGCRWNEWEEFMERNKDSYTMYAITAPGYGGTAAPNLPNNSDSTPYRDYLITGLSELIDLYELEELTVVGHSWGAMVATQLAANRNDVVVKLISIDGKITGAKIKDNIEARLEEANKLVVNWGSKLQSAEEWSKFNGASTGLALGNQDSVSREVMLTQIKLKTSFMASDRTSMIQYWRENLIIDLTQILKAIKIPILDIQSFSGKNQDIKKKEHLDKLKLANTTNVTSVFMYDTKHFIMYHRPKELDCIIEDFMNGKASADYAPKISEYFEEKMN